MDTTKLTDEKAASLCRFGQGAACCSFLVLHDGFACSKGSSLERIIRSRRRRPGSMNAMGNNCSGPPDFGPTDQEVEEAMDFLM